MKHVTKEARTFLMMYKESKSTYHLKRALQNDRNYTIIVSIENGFYWKVREVLNEL